MVLVRIQALVINFCTQLVSSPGPLLIFEFYNSAHQALSPRQLMYHMTLLYIKVLLICLSALHFKHTKPFAPTLD